MIITDSVGRLAELDQDLMEYGQVLGLAVNLTDNQAKLLLRLGDRELTVGDLALTRCYVEKNVSYNIKKLAEAGLLVVKGAPQDGRVNLISATIRGRVTQRKIREAHEAFLARNPWRARRMLGT